MLEEDGCVLSVGLVSWLMVVCQGAGLACGEAIGEDISEDNVSDGGAVPLVVAGAVVAETSGGAPAASNHEKVWLLRELLLSPFCVFCLLSVRGRCCTSRTQCEPRSHSWAECRLLN